MADPRSRLPDHEQMADAQAGCVSCKLCGGQAVISDAGTGAGYYIKCSGTTSWRASTGCMIDMRRLGGWAYNVRDWWNRLHSTDAANGAEQFAENAKTSNVLGDASVEAAYRAGWAQASIDETMRGTVEAGWQAWDHYRQYLLATTPGGDLLEQAERDHNGGYTVAEVEAMDDEPRYLIRKGGAYYRKNSQGYTHHREAAGRYRLDEAIAITHPNGPNGPRDGMDYVLDTAGDGGEA